MRAQDAATVKVSEMVLCGSINKKISAAIAAAGGHALGLSGKDDKLIVAERLVKMREGLSGAPTRRTREFLEKEKKTRDSHDERANE